MDHEAVIFDFFGVLCSQIAPMWTRKRLPQEDVHDIHERYIRAGDSGSATEAQVFEELSQVAHESPADIAQEWQELIEIDQEVVALVRELHESGYRTGLCSNAWASFIYPILSDYHLTELFDDILVSSEVGMTKPDERIFRLAAERLGVEPAACVFVDDSPHNAAAAEKVGMRTITFSDAGTLRRQFQDLGLER